MRGARFNPKSVPALYLATSVMAAVKEANQGLAHRIDPCVLCSYEIDCDDIADLTTKEGREEFAVLFEEMDCAWAAMLADGERPSSWSIYDRLRPMGVVGILVPSFAPGAELNDSNLVLWEWGPELPHKVVVHDPSGRLPKDQLSWL